MRLALSLSPCNRWGNPGLESLNNLPKVTDLCTQGAPCVLNIPSSDSTFFVRDNLPPCERCSHSRSYHSVQFAFQLWSRLCKCVSIGLQVYTRRLIMFSKHATPNFSLVDSTALNPQLRGLHMDFLTPSARETFLLCTALSLFFIFLKPDNATFYSVLQKVFINHYIVPYIVTLGFLFLCLTCIQYKMRIPCR